MTRIMFVTSKNLYFIEVYDDSKNSDGYFIQIPLFLYSAEKWLTFQLGRLP